MSTRARHLETFVGGFLLAGVGALVFLLVVSVWGKGWFTAENEYQLVLDDGVGLAPGVDVTIAGMRVGSVTDMRLTDERHVSLTLSVDADYAQHVKADSQGSATMTLGGKVVRIGAGTAQAQVLADGGTLVSGNNFDVFKALEKMDLVGNLQRMEAILIDLNALADQMHLGDGRMTESMDNVMLLVADLQAGRGTIGRLLKEEATLDEMLSAIQAVDSMAASVAQAAKELETTSHAVQGASTSINDGAVAVTQASEALAGTATSVDQSAAKLASSLDRLDAGLVELERTMRAIQGLPLVRKQVEKNE